MEHFLPIRQKVQEAWDIKILKGYENALMLLEEAHLISQPYVWTHIYVHWKMLLLAIEFRNWKEVRGQIPRLFLAGPGSLFGKAPKGNVGSTKMGIFEER